MVIEIEIARITALFLFGFVLGIGHAFNADHVVAVTVMVTKAKKLRKASLFGALWGAGHTLSLLLVGIVIMLVKISIPNAISLSLEFIVGAVVFLLGFLVFRDVGIRHMHTHPHRHGALVHAHPHAHKQAKDHDHAHRTFFIGMLHGLAGSAALMLIVLTTINSFLEGVLYIITFGIGSIFGMLVISTLIGLPFVLTDKRAEEMNRRIQLVVGIVSMVLGVLIMVQIGFLEGLFLTRT